LIEHIDFSALVIKSDQEAGAIEEKTASYFMEKLGVKLEELDISQSVPNLVSNEESSISFLNFSVPPITPFRGPIEWLEMHPNTFAGKYGGTLFGLSTAITYALQRGINTIYYGIHDDDRTAYPENTRDYFDTLAKLVEIETGRAFNILTPLIEMSKSDVILLGEKMGVELEKTRSCGSAQIIQCGICGACKARRKAFEKSEIPDNTNYQNEIPKLIVTSNAG